MFDIRVRLDPATGLIHFGDFLFPKEFACKCCGQCDILADLWQACEWIRMKFAAPVNVHSAYRCERHNRSVGGKPASDHLMGFAADISIEGHTPEELRLAATNLPTLVKRIGVYPWGIHIGVRDRGPGAWRFWRVNEAGNIIESR